MSKCIIKNCPAIYGIDDGFLCSYREDNESEKYCYDCIDCKLKQIVELCKPLNTKQPESYYNLELLLARKILKLLDVQEVE